MTVSKISLKDRNVTVCPICGIPLIETRNSCPSQKVYSSAYKTTTCKSCAGKEAMRLFRINKKNRTW